MKANEIPSGLVLYFMQNAILAWLQKTGIDGWMLDGPSWLKWIRYKLTGMPELQFLYPPAEVTIVVSQRFVRDSKGWVVVRQYTPLFPALRSRPKALSGAYRQKQIPRRLSDLGG